MASKLVNLLRKLEWSDFPKVDKTAPKAGQMAFGAQTATEIVPGGFGVEPVPNGGGKVRMKDTLTVTINFVRAQSWVAKWVFTKPQQFQLDLLKHERGHYQLAGLLARDFFLAAMKLKAKTYANSGALQTDLNALNSKYLKKASALDAKYETDTANGTKPVEQKQWDGLINKAFTTSKVPAQQTPDGTVIKVEILDVLKTAGITI
jgi:hypothetical protein